MKKDKKVGVKQDYKNFLKKDRFQVFLLVMAFFTLMYLFGQVEYDFYTMIAERSTYVVFGADALDNVTNFGSAK